MSAPRWSSPTWRDLGPAVERCRHLLDLDADPVAVDLQLGRDPLLAPLVAAMAGRRSPGSVDGAETLTRIIVGQQVSVAGARTVTGRITERPRKADHLGRRGRSRGRPTARLTHCFPTAEALAATDPETLPMPRARGRALVAAATLVADGSLVIDPGADRAEVTRTLLGVSGIGPWTTSALAMRAFGDPDVFLPTDLGVLRSLAALGHPGDAAAAERRAQAWRPWRSYALHHLWSLAYPDRTRPAPAGRPHQPGLVTDGGPATTIDQTWA